MTFAEPLQEGILLRRFQRFLAEVRLPSGEVVLAHTNNTGAMLGCGEPGLRVWLSRARRPGRRCPWTWELSETREGVLVGVNTQRANALVAEALEEGRLPPLAGYAVRRREAPFGPFGAGRSRVDLLLEGPGRPPCYVEVKNVTAAREGLAFFPDAPTARGRRHLQALMAAAAAGRRAVLCFCVQRGDARALRPADEIDPAYGRALREAARSGVELLAWRARVTLEGLWLERPLPLRLPPSGTPRRPQRRSSRE
ncbi:MAG: DNA/RNA nuclease SfsA [Gammaproteobacteria bacterium]|nr:MAG: DNA/RNA nuclease SfsA [Gammaproteobacteria bacterium]